MRSARNRPEIPAADGDDDDDADTRERLLTSLFEAIIADDGDEVEDLLECGAAVDSVDGSGRSALMKACAAAHAELVEKLIELGASSSLRDCGGADALCWACECRDEDKEEEDLVACANALLAAGAAVDTADLAGTTPLMRAASLGRSELASALLAAGADSAQRDERGRCAIGLALASGQAELATRLLAEGATCDLASAAALGDVARVREMLAAAAPRNAGGGAQAAGGLYGGPHDGADSVSGCTPRPTAPSTARSGCGCDGVAK